MEECLLSYGSDALNYGVLAKGEDDPAKGVTGTNDTYIIYRSILVWENSNLETEPKTRI